MPQPFDRDEAAADHHQLFGFNLFPYEAIFRDESGLLGGPVTEHVLVRYQAWGYAPEMGSVSPDHIGHELGLLAYLSGVEAGARQAADEAAAQRARGRQMAFLQEHLLPWLLPLAIALRRQPNPFFAALAQVTVTVVQNHSDNLRPESHHQHSRGPTKMPRKEDLGSWGLGGESFAPHPGPLPTGERGTEAEELLEDEKTGLKQIAGFLVTPPRSGIYLGRDELARLARQMNLPRGFGGRQQILLTLLRSAGQYDAWEGLLDALRGVTAAWGDEYEQYATSWPAVAPIAAAWRQRTEDTIGLLAGLAA